MALPLFAVTLFVSAFLLFLVQPIIGKMILPKLGGTPQVWNTCMVFFQTALLAGYAYTHTVSTRLPLRRQLITHAIVFFLPFLVLLPPYGPFKLTGSFNEGFFLRSLGGNPIFDTLGLLTCMVGLPFLVVATSAPLLQKWFASTGHPAAKDPYFLYGASNLGSLLALLLYPVTIELWLDLNPQAWVFTAGYCVLLVLVLACAAMVWQTSGQGLGLAPPAEATPPSMAEATGITANPPAPAAAPEAAKSTGIKKGPPKFQGKGGPRPTGQPDIALPGAAEEVTPWRRLRWIGLAAVPSSLMLGVTTHITTDLSPIPLFWLVPLTLYLLSFILVFSRWPVLWVDQPHKICLVAQPIALALMIFVEILGLSSSQIWVAVFFDVLAFFLTALVCHGELAKDRPDTKHLTEYYLLMSVGGMLGGMFNGLLAPVLFYRVIEFNIAVFLACLLRPTMKEEGWTDNLLVGMLEQQPAAKHHHHGKGHKHAPAPAHAAEEPPSYTGILDYALPFGILILMSVMVFAMGGILASLANSLVSSNNPEAVNGMRLLLTYGIPLGICCLYYGRPIRFGLGIGAVLLVYAIYQNKIDSSIFVDRSYFGIIRVKDGEQSIHGSTFRYHQLIHGHINHGMNFVLPPEKDQGNPDRDYSRLATTYYHRYGPAGVVMEHFNWFPGPQNTYWADARMPASQVGLTVDALGSFALPTSALVGLWSEPPYATIGLGTGTMASYGRPFQHVHYYEIDNHIRRLSLPENGTEPFFNYLQQAKKRGSEVQVLMGDARLRMALDYQNHNTKEGFDRGGGPDNFYHMMVVDAFSSDAIPVHLITKEALELYFKKLTKEGILCVHTSNRFVELPKVVAAVTQKLGFSCLRGHDNAPDNKEEVGHFTSEWVMVAREAEYLKHLRRPPTNNQSEEYWQTPIADQRYLWTDDHSNLISVLRR